MKSVSRRLLLTVAAASFGHAAWAQSASAKPLRWIVPYAAGGGQDFIARTVAPQLSTAIGRQVVVENKPGGNGAIAAGDLLRSSPDGSAIMSIDNGHMVLNPILYKNLSYSPARDLMPVTGTGRIPLLIVAGPGAAQTAEEFLAQARQQPDKFAYASVGNGSPHHIAMELFKQRAGIRLVHVPYRGGAPALADVAGGQVPYLMADLAFSFGFIEAGKVRPLAVGTATRLPMLPRVPTFEEIGVKGAEAAAFTGVVVAAGTPAKTVAALSEAIANVLHDPAVAKKLRAASVEPFPLTPAQFTEMIDRERRIWGKVIEEQKISVE